MMRLLRLLPLFLLATGLMAGTRIRHYHLVLTAGPEGAGQAVATLDLEACVPGPLVVPLGFAAPRLQTEAGPAGIRLEAGTHSVRVILPEGVAPACTVAFSFPVAQVYQPTVAGNGGGKPVPATSRVLRHALVNTQETPIEDYRFEFRLPEGWKVQTIREQLPKLGKAEVGPRVRLDKVGTRQGAVLQLSAMAQGDDTVLALELTPNRKSPLWLLVGLCLGGLYLFYFRDLVAAKPA